MAQLYPVFVSSRPEIFGIVAHEILHTLAGYRITNDKSDMLCDVLENDNIMCYGMSEGAKRGILRFREQTCVYTGTPNKTDDMENQWNAIYRE